ncbi:hypothetical protein SCP_1101420 [Sparassis crispa]|uniref:Uncharacterized protein n=1 Tax=Sparassis crispa TaxID=139825 RepID=A0A401GZ65_9APHY|nr:hypothetical protein SCP_1101420 [Sparassis crispa]GBE87466.1 hypothetical protein SCP_1101420 [Sparassis crispa]
MTVKLEDTCVQEETESAGTKLVSIWLWLKQELAERSQTIGGVDNMWILLTDATEFNPVCAGTFTYRGKLTFEMAEHASNIQAKKFPRYRQRLTSLGRRLHGARFEDDPDFDMRNHVEVVTLSEPAGKRELEDLMGEFLARGWDLKRPLWDMILVENYHDEDGAESAMIIRGHHTLADGQGFVISELYMSSYHDELVELMTNGANQLHAARRGHLRPSKLHPALRCLDQFTSNVDAAPLLTIFLAALFWLSFAVSMAVSLFWSTYQTVHQAILFLLTCWRVDMITGDQPRRRTPFREYSTSRVFSIDDVKLCQQAFSGPRPGSAVSERERGKSKHVTLNDVLCSVMADVLGKEIAAKPVQSGRWGWVKRQLKKILPSPVGIIIPVSVREPGDWSMRNLATASITYLYPLRTLSSDISTRELHAHIHECHNELALLKHSSAPKFWYHVLQLTGQVPFPVRIFLQSKSVKGLRRVWRRLVTIPVTSMFLDTYAAVLTNVPGPAKNRVSMEGIEMIRWTALPPQAGKGTLGIGIISYAGGICISVAADAVPSSQGVARRICKSFEERFELYVERARQVVEHQD